MLCISLRLVDLNNYLNVMYQFKISRPKLKKKQKLTDKPVKFMSKKALLYCLRLGSEYAAVELRN